MLTQKDLNGAAIEIAEHGKLVIWARQTGTKGLYQITYMNGTKVTRGKLAKGIKEVRAIAGRFNALYN